jgi:hypothetical protein
MAAKVWRPTDGAQPRAPPLSAQRPADCGPTGFAMDAAQGPHKREGNQCTLLTIRMTIW